MPFERRTLSELRQQVRQDIVTSTPVGGALLPNSVLAVLGDVQAGLAHLEYGYLDWIARQAVPYTATEEFLEAWSALVGITRKPAVAATGTVTFSGVDGNTIPAGTEVLRGDGAVYHTAADVTVSSSIATVTVTADLAGTAGNTAVSTTMTLAGAIAGVQSNGAVAAAIAGGVDVETDDSLRTRMLLRYSQPPQGGAANDYVEWALAVPAVTRAWCYPLGMGAGTVVVYFMEDVVRSGGGGFPVGTNGGATDEMRTTAATGDQLVVADAIYPLRPVTSLVYVSAPTANPIAFTISLPGASAGTKAAVSAAIADVFLRYGVPIAGTSVNLDHIEAAILAVPNTEGFVITSPTTNIANVTGQLPTVGVITWT